MGKGAGAATSLDARGGKFRCMIEDMASMTEKGILWHFPINNEQGIDEDQVGILRYIPFRNQGDF